MEYCNGCSTKRWPSWPKCSTGQCSWASPKRICSPANPQVQNIAASPGPGDPEAQNDPPPPGPANPQDQNTPPPPDPANPDRRIGLRLGNIYWQKNAHQLANIPGQIQLGPSMGILGMPLGIKHAPANLPGPINLPGREDIPVQIQANPPMGILRRPMGMRHAPLADIPEAAALNIQDPLIQSFDVAQRVHSQCQVCPKLVSFFGNNLDVFFLNLLT